MRGAESLSGVVAEASPTNTKQIECVESKRGTKAEKAKKAIVAQLMRWEIVRLSSLFNKTGLHWQADFCQYHSSFEQCHFPLIHLHSFLTGNFFNDC